MGRDRKNLTLPITANKLAVTKEAVNHSTGLGALYREEEVSAGRLLFTSMIC